ncbi:DUF3256 family protein [Porphyromonas loveana]|uniref:DUF3256 family protein n=1 Tax=Porphyromonas loveana TaxID=1884669 RepID=UPI0035A15F43
MKRNTIARFVRSFCLSGVLIGGYAFGGIIPASAQQIDDDKLGRCFVAMPDSLMPLLSTSEREELCAPRGIYSNDNRIEFVTTRLGQLRYERSNHTITLQSSSASVITIRHLQLPDSTFILCMVTTALLPVEDSQIAFFSDKWEPLPTDRFIQMPQMDDFVLPCTDKESYTYQATYKHLRPFYMRIDISGAPAILTARQTVIETLAVEEKPLAAQFLLKESLAYMWKDGRFVFSPSITSQE